MSRARCATAPASAALEVRALLELGDVRPGLRDALLVRRAAAGLRRLAALLRRGLPAALAHRGDELLERARVLRRLDVLVLVDRAEREVEAQRAAGQPVGGLAVLLRDVEAQLHVQPAQDLVLLARPQLERR